MKNLFVTLGALLVVVMVFSGCATKQTLTGSETSLDGNAVVAVTDNMTDRFGADVAKVQARYSAAKDVIVAKETTKQEEAKARQAEAANTPTVVISEATYKELETVRALREATRSVTDMGKLVGAVALALAGDGDMRVFTKDTPAPKGVIAESIEAVGGAAEKVANTPAAFILGAGQAMKWVAKEVKQEINTSGDVNTGSGNQTNGLTGGEVEAVVTAATAEEGAAPAATESTTTATE